MPASDGGDDFVGIGDPLEGFGMGAIHDRADVAFDEIETRPLRRFNESLHFVEIALVAGREIVKAGDALIKLQKRLQQIRANESRPSGH